MIRLMKCSICSQRALSSLLTRKKYNFSYCDRLSLHSLNYRMKSDNSKVSSLFIPVPVKPENKDENIGAELTGNTLNKNEVVRVLNQFCQHPDVRSVLQENGMDNYIQQQAFVAFRRYCLEVNNLPVDIHVVISDVLQGAGHVTDILPYFMRFSKQMFPHLDCMDDLKNISDLRSPANWYPEARASHRRIIFHAGPTNSGKTYHALERFLNAASGVYCGPLKLLATEVYRKANDSGTPCDLITGEERKFGRSENEPSSHVSCTVEMASLIHKYEVAVIDEIQMMKDPGRGWAWTRALLGINAQEVHVCGEAGAVELVKSILCTTNEQFELFQYKRLTSLNIEKTAVGSLNNVRDGDCIVCFSKNDVYSVTTGIEARGKEVAVIYGGLPPNTKLAQAQKFNDPNNSCNVLVATDAIGMGLNLSIRRIIFYSLVKPTVNEKGEKEMDVISVSQALQIAGRAGRYKTQHETGYVTTFKAEDLSMLKQLLARSPELINKAGVHPTAEQIELYAYHLPHATFSNLIDIFVNLSTVDDSLYFMCAIEDFKYVADMIQHIPLPLRARYIFCCAPINRKMQFVCSSLRKFAKQYSVNEPITLSWVQKHVSWPLSTPKTLLELVHLEAVFDVLDLYLWFSYRFPDIFIHPNPVREMQVELDLIIQQGVTQITRLLKSTGKVSHIEEADLFVDVKDNNSKKPSIKKGNLTKTLLDQGLLTKEMLMELQKEWTQEKKTLLNQKESKSERKNDLMAKSERQNELPHNCGAKVEKMSNSQANECKNQMNEVMMKNISETSPPVKKMNQNSEVELKKTRKVKIDSTKKRSKKTSSSTAEEFEEVINVDVEMEKTTQISNTPALENSTSEMEYVPRNTSQVLAKEMVKRIDESDTKIEGTEKSTPSKSIALSSSFDTEFVSKDISKSMEGEKKFLHRNSSFISREVNRQSEKYSNDNENRVNTFQPRKIIPPPRKVKRPKK